MQTNFANMDTHEKKLLGFTLIEVLVSATIIAILTAAGFVSYQSVNKKSRDARRKSDIEQIRSALEQYKSDNGYYAYVPNMHIALSTPTPPARTFSFVETVYAQPGGGLTPSPSPTPDLGSFALAQSTLTYLKTGGYISSVPDDPDTSRHYYVAFDSQNVSNGKYYGYCLAAYLDDTSADNQCSVSLPGSNNYGRKNP